MGNVNLNYLMWLFRNAANMHILYKLIETKQLPTYEDVKTYLAYTIKLNQLTGKYKWISILMIYVMKNLELLKHNTRSHGL